ADPPPPVAQDAAGHAEFAEPYLAAGADRRQHEVGHDLAGPEVDVGRARVAGQVARLVVPQLVVVGGVPHAASELGVDGQEARVGRADGGDVQQHGTDAGRRHTA